MTSWRCLSRAGIAAFLVANCGVGFSQSKPETPEANPSRPTITNPATLPPVGYLQFEQGYLGSLDSPETVSQHGFNWAVKLAVHPRLMVQVQSQPFAASVILGVNGVSNDAGDVLLGFETVLFTPTVAAEEGLKTKDRHRHAFVHSAIPTVTVGYLGRVHEGSAPDIDLGSVSQSFVLLLSGHVPDVHYDINFVVNDQPGQATTAAPVGTTVASSALVTHDIRRAQYAQTFSLDRPFFNPNLQFSAEIYHFTQPLVNATSSGQAVPRANLVGGLLALGYQLRPNLVFDGGFERGLTSTSTQWQAFAGFTYLLPHRLWPEHKS